MIAKTYTEYISTYNSIINTQNDTATPLKIAILRSFSCEVMEQLLTVNAYERGYRCEIHLGAYGQYAQEILNPDSAIYSFAPDITLLAVNIEDISRRVFDAGKLPSPADFETLSDDLDAYLNLISTLLERVGGTIVILSFVKPFFAGEPYFDMDSKYGFGSLIRSANTKLLDFSQGHKNIFVFDMDGLVSTFGRNNAFDIKQWYLSKNPYRTTFLIEFSKSLMGLVEALRLKRKKCIVLDLDDTLWRGIIGEDGLAGIEINECFKDFQSQLLYWKNSGILLAVNSKNNHDDAIEVFEKHPDMVLRKDDFACFAINWNDKASNLAHIASELNIGLDSMIFVDDSEFECEFVRKECPAVEVIRLDGNYINYAKLAREISSLNFAYLSDEDIGRTGMYKAQAERKTLLAASESLTAYLESLSTELKIELMSELTTRRAAQLTQKTNQFNLTTRRYTVNDVMRMQADGFLIFLVGVKDKFGDSGISGLAIIDTSNSGENDAKAEKTWRIDNFLLSCRVMGRHIEKAVWAYIVKQAHAADIKAIKGEYIPTAKNKPVEDLLASFGFVKKDEKWEFKVSKGYSQPDYIIVKN